MKDSEIEILKEPDELKPFAIIYKPAGLASAPLTCNDSDNAFCKVAKLFPQMLQVKGKKEIEHGLIHRLDTATSGLMIIASTQECYDFLIQEQKEDRIIKKYNALCDITNIQLDGFPKSPLDITNNLREGNVYKIVSYFRPFGPGRKQVRPVTDDCGKAAIEKIGKQVLYTTNILIKKIDTKNKTANVECSITNGYRHQVRCHLAWCGLPVKNDIIYNPNNFEQNKSAETMKFCATSIQFEYPRGDLNSYDRKDTWT